MPPWDVHCTRSARNQFATMHLKYRGRIVANAEAKIVDALEQNPTGGLPLSSGLWSVIVHLLRATYRIDGRQVTVVEYQESLPP